MRTLRIGWGTACGVAMWLSTVSYAADPGDDIIRQINAHRQRNGLPAIPTSAKLNRVAAAHMDDLATHHPDTGTHPANGMPCNMHSWSAHGNWAPMCYTDNHAEAERMWSKPREIAGYAESGYEVSARGQRDAAAIVAIWQGSPGHNEVLLNRGMWSNYTWRAVGAAKAGDYSCAWFGTLRDDSTPVRPPSDGPIRLAIPLAPVFTNKPVLLRMMGPVPAPSSGAEGTALHGGAPIPSRPAGKTGTLKK